MASLFAIPAVERRGFRRQRVEAAFHQPIPARIVQSAPRLPAAHQQPVLGSGQRDVEQPVVLLHPPLLRRVAQPLGGGAAHLPPRRPDRHVAPGGRIGRPQDRPFVGRQRRGVRQDHQRRLQSLGAVHRHHPHQAAGAFRLALHLRARAAQPVQKPLQRQRMHAAIGQRRVQQLVHRFGGFRTEPGKQPRPPTERPQRLGEQRVRRDVVDPRQQGRKERPGRLPVRPLLRPCVQRLPQRRVPPDRQIRRGCRPTGRRVGWSAGRQRSGRPAAAAAHRRAPSGPAPPAARSASAGPARPPARPATSGSAPARGRSRSCDAPAPSRRRGRAAAPCSPASRRRRPPARSIAPASPPEFCGAEVRPRFWSGTVHGSGSSASGSGASGHNSTAPAWSARSA